MTILGQTGNPQPPAPPTPGTGGAIGGFSRTQCIEIAQKRTERRGASLDLGSEFIAALQEVCMETRWWWRRKTAIFTLTSGTAKYDLTDQSGFNAADFHQAARKSVRIYNQVSGSPSGQANWRTHTIEPEFDPLEQDKILALQSTFPSGPPCKYFVQWPYLYFDVPPDQNYQASIGYWAVPNFTDDSADETIPLVPSYAHSLIIKRLEMHIEHFSMAESGAAKYEAAAAEYREMVAGQQIYNRFADGQVNEIRNAVFGDAVQSS
jgi:hypothetical protein